MAAPSTKLQLLSGPEVESILREEGVEVYKYTINKPGLILFVAVALGFYAVAGLIWWETQLSAPIWTVAFVCLLLVGTAFSAIPAYWHQFVNQNVVAASPARLFVGGPRKLWSISWELLDKRSLGFEEMELSRISGALSIRVGGQVIKLHLFNALAYLQDIESLIFRLLNHIADQEEAAEAAGPGEEE